MFPYSTATTTAAIKDEDVKVIVEDCEVSKETAELYLRHFEGDLHKVLTAFARGETSAIVPHKKK